jgi:DNA mismatch repair ATPase MutS
MSVGIIFHFIDLLKNHNDLLKLMSKDSKTNEWDSLWGEYSKSLENWKSIFEQFQKASNDMQTKFNQVWEKASAESSPETIKDFTENWQKSMTDTDASVFKQFTENWQTTLSSSGLEQMNAYGEMMKKFSETWKSMWPKLG